MLTNGFLFIGQVIIPRVLTKEDYAQFTISVSFVAIFSLLADLGMNPYFTKVFAEAEEVCATGTDSRGDLIGSALALRSGLALIASLTAVLSGFFLYSSDFGLRIAILSTTLITSSRIFIFRAVMESTLKGIGRYHVAVFCALVDAATFAGTFLFLRGQSLSLENVLWIYALCNLPGFILISYVVRRWIREEHIVLRLRPSIIKQMFRTSLPLTLGTVFLTIHTEIDKILLGKLSTFQEVAHYGVSIRLSAAAAPVPLVLAAIAAPELTRLLKRGDVARSRKLTDVSLRVLLAAAGCLALLTTCLSSEIVNVIFGAKYAGASPVLVWVGWLLLPIFIGTLLMEFSVASGEMWLFTSNTGVGMILVIIGDLFLIPIYGAQGAMASKLIAVTCGAAVILGLARRSPYLDLSSFLVAAIKTGVSLGLSVALYAFLSPIVMPGLLKALATITLYLALLHSLRVTTFIDAASLYKKIFKNVST